MQRHGCSGRKLQLRESWRHEDQQGTVLLADGALILKYLHGSQAKLSALQAAAFPPLNCSKLGVCNGAGGAVPSSGTKCGVSRCNIACLTYSFLSASRVEAWLPGAYGLEAFR